MSAFSLSSTGFSILENNVTSVLFLTNTRIIIAEIHVTSVSELLTGNAVSMTLDDTPELDHKGVD